MAYYPLFFLKPLAPLKQGCSSHIWRSYLPIYFALRIPVKGSQSPSGSHSIYSNFKLTGVLTTILVRSYLRGKMDSKPARASNLERKEWNVRCRELLAEHICTLIIYTHGSALIGYRCSDGIQSRTLGGPSNHLRKGPIFLGTP